MRTLDRRLRLLSESKPSCQCNHYEVFSNDLQDEVSLGRYLFICLRGEISSNLLLLIDGGDASAAPQTA
jgi:hypothetical protein